MITEGLDLVGVILLAVVVEAVINIVKLVVKEKQLDWLVVLSLAVGIIAACSYRIDILAQFGVEAVQPTVGYVLTGILLSRGSNYMADITRLMGLKLTTNKMLIQAATEIEEEEQQPPAPKVPRKPIIK